MKPLRNEVVSHWLAVCERISADGGHQTVSQTQMHDAMVEWWEVLTDDERRAIGAWAFAVREREQRN